MHREGVLPEVQSVFLLVEAQFHCGPIKGSFGETVGEASHEVLP